MGAPIRLVTAFCLTGVLCSQGIPIEKSIDTTVEVFRKDQDVLLGCQEIGLIAETDGAQELKEGCSCDNPHYEVGTEEGAIELVQKTGREMGANAVWIMRTYGITDYITHSGECCYVQGYRAWAVAFRCDVEALDWHKGHEKSKGG